ncbi:MAG TPA: DNA replication and repair protein RecF [Candidatus Limnocylindria bacterium]|nr:DNA replication and repair protein RecF [Candidatus Limnocylindria bacterium]
MRLTRLVLEDFRSYASAELHPEPGLTIVAGPNGAGKTNLLEAIFVAVTGRSHRAGADAELVRHSRPFARVRLDLSDPQGAATARVELLVPAEDAPPEIRKRVTVNGLARRASSIGDTVRVVLFRPEEMLLLVGAPSERRRFLDAILAQRHRAAARDLGELGRILAQRNALLRAIRREEATPDNLAFWDEQLALVGARVMAARLNLVADLAAALPALHDAVAPVDERGEQVRLSYADTLKDAWPERPSVAGRAPALEELEAAYRRRIGQVREKELWNGVSLVGPHRDDLRVELAGREVATHASRGQQRTIILSLKLAETDLLGSDGAPTPIVLLDDVFSELDADRSERLLSLLLERGQVLVTMADLSTLPAGRRGVTIWQVGEGRLSEAPRVA